MTDPTCPTISLLTCSQELFSLKMIPSHQTITFTLYQITKIWTGLKTESLCSRQFKCGSDDGICFVYIGLKTL